MSTSGRSLSRRVVSARARRLSFESLELRELLAADLQGVSLLATDAALWGNTIAVQAQVRNAGDVSAAAFRVEFYLSQDAVGSTSDVRLTRTNLTTYYSHTSLAAGATGAGFTVDLKLPTALPSGFTGENFYVLMKVDSDSRVAESSESNNFGQLGDGIDRDPIAITAPDIAVTFGAVNIADNDISPSTTDGTNFGSVPQLSAGVSRTFTVRNAGTGVLTLGAVVVPAGFTLAEGLVGSLAAGASDTFTVTLDTFVSGAKSGQVSITTNDVNETPFNFAIRGTVAASSLQPEIAVRFGATNVADNDTTATTLDGTDFGSAVVGSPITRTFTVVNEGANTLTLGTIVLPTGFTLTEGLPSYLAVGASDTFTVRLDATTIGSKSGYIRFNTNDANENPFNFAIKGSVAAAAPEVTVLFGAQNVADNDTSPITTDGTDFGSVVQGGTLTRTFTVRNDGTSTLALGAVAVPTGFTLTEGLASSLAVGASDTFTVAINTATVASRSGSVSFATNDGNENPFNFSIKGTVVAAVPEVAVLFGAQNIVDNDGSPSALEGTLFGTATQGDPPISRTFTVRNDGTGTLTLGAITVPTGFALAEGLPASLAPGASDTFTVELLTASVGSKSGQISLASNDSNENPFNFSLSGVVVAPTPDVTVLFGAQNIADGDSTPSALEGTAFGNVPLGDPVVSRTFTVRNDGSATLTLGTVSLPAGFTLAEGLAASLAPGASDTFTVELNTATAGSRSGQISFSTNDSGENPFNFSISGTVTVPEVTVEFSGVNIADNDATPTTADGTNFGSAVIGLGAISRTFTVSNDGAAPLTLGAISLPTGYTLTDGLASSLAAGASDTFTVRLDTAVLGTKSGQISFATNDAGENPFNFNITGEVTSGTIDLAGLSLQAPSSTQWGRAITVQAQIRNNGTGASGPFTVEWYLSQDTTGSTANDVLLSRTSGNGTSYSHSSIAAGSNGSAFSVELQLPSTIPGGFSGTDFHLIMRVDAAGALAESNEANNFGQVGEGSDRTAMTILATDTFTRHSLPGATKVIYLDFDGHTTTDPAWNGGSTFVTPRYDSDGNTTSFSAAELTAIEEMWAKVAEDFLPFEVDVTTEFPGIEALRNTGGGDTEWGVRVVIGGTGSWYGGGGGVAQLFSFDANRDIPCFVFSDNFGDFGPNIAEAISHEAGHTLGLGHDGRTSPAEEYFDGHGTAPNRWGPIMGTAYYRDISQWSQGEYTAATNTQDDLSIITTGNGFTYRTDDHANSSAGATSLAVESSTSLSAEGIIERNTDVDFFTFTVTTPGTVNIGVSPAAIGANLDILARLFNSSLVQIGSDNPSATLSANISQVLAAGTYYLSVDGVGFGNPATDGYSDYASLGYFSIDVTATGGGAFSTAAPTVAAAPPLAPAQAGAPAEAGGAALASLPVDAGDHGQYASPMLDTARASALPLPVAAKSSAIAAAARLRAFSTLADDRPGDFAPRRIHRALEIEAPNAASNREAIDELFRLWTAADFDRRLEA